MTFLTFGGKCVLAAACSPRSDATAAMPRPAEVRWRKRRRVTACHAEAASESSVMITSVPGSSLLLGGKLSQLCCSEQGRDGCIIRVFSTPRDAENHAKFIRRRVDGCPHS